YPHLALVGGPVGVVAAAGGVHGVGVDHVGGAAGLQHAGDAFLQGGTGHHPGFGTAGFDDLGLDAPCLHARRPVQADPQPSGARDLHPDVHVAAGVVPVAQVQPVADHRCVPAHGQVGDGDAVVARGDPLEAAHQEGHVERGTDLTDPAAHVGHVPAVD